MPVLEPKEAHGLFEVSGCRVEATRARRSKADSRDDLVNVNVTEANHPAAEKLARLAAWAHKTDALKVDGLQPGPASGDA